MTSVGNTFGVLPVMPAAAAMEVQCATVHSIVLCWHRQHTLVGDTS